MVVFSILVKLGLWQLSRGEQKSELEHTLAARQTQPERSISSVSVGDDVTGLKVSGQFSPVPGAYVLLDNQTFEGKVGYLAYQVMTSGKQALLLERGFVPSTGTRQVLPEVDWLTEPKTLQGRLYQRSMNPLSADLGLEETNPIRIQSLDIDALSTWFEITLEPYVLQPTVQNWPYAQPWRPVPLSSTKHYGYALQWFSMALALLVLSGWILMKTLKNNKTRSEE
ncbi:hypothetical protein VPR01S_12_00240 [Vibrio proteolyticus NBRC 13287]|uniref:SURF1-like protein n=1 Tax=Vibrio proteolyticus NBRC 13287 TaxID=1219065 RepID=U2ZKD3_VIBPR|nr:hypothetical protein VPR01S_12_00240 [Vibrio proteolyticus NBRC 13287]